MMIFVVLLGVVVICGCIIIGAVEARRTKEEKLTPLINNNNSKDTSVEFQMKDIDLQNDEEVQEKVLLPKLEMTVESISSRTLFAFLFVGILQWILIAMAHLNPNELSNLWALCRLVFVVSMLSLLYKIWAIIRLGDVSIQPGVAIFRLLVPIYNIYWIFELFWGWAKHYNNALCRYNVKQPQMSETLGIAASTAWFVPIVGFFIFIVHASGPKYYVQREGEYVQVLHQQQLRVGEEIYTPQFPGAPFLRRASRFLLPTKMIYYFPEAVKLTSYLYFDIIIIWFFIKAVMCANFLSETHMKIRDGTYG